MEQFSLKSLRRVTLGLCGLTLGGIMLWSVAAPMDAAVMGQGTVKVSGSVKAVQHPEGGVVTDLHVTEGARIEAGAVVLQLDQTSLRADLTAIEARLIEIGLRRARLMAERDGHAFVPPAEIATRASDPLYGPVTRDALADEAALFDIRAQMLAASLTEFAERSQGLGAQMVAVEAQKTAMARSLEVLSAEAEDMAALSKQSLVTQGRLRGAERERAEAESTLAGLEAEYARLAGERILVEGQHRLAPQERHSAILEELRALMAEQLGLERERISAQDRLSRSALMAPVSGRVHEMAVHTKGGVLAAGETAMVIVPDSGDLRIEVRINPADIDQVYQGQAARLRLSAFNQRTTPEITGTVVHVSADLSEDPQSGASWYELHVIPDPEALAALPDLELRPGMPSEVFLLGESRTFLSYLMKPVSDHLAVALNES